MVDRKSEIRTHTFEVLFTLQRLRAAGAKVGDNQTIKIQAIQTNPTTGVRQIVAIPIQTTSAAASPAQATTVSYSPAGRSSGVGGGASPLKVIRVPAGSVTSAQGGTQIVTMSPAQLAAATAGAAGGDGGLPSNVKVVKIPAGTASAYGSPAGVSPAAGGYSIKQGTYIKTPGTQVDSSRFLKIPKCLLINTVQYHYHMFTLS